MRHEPRDGAARGREHASPRDRSTGAFVAATFGALALFAAHVAFAGSGPSREALVETRFARHLARGDGFVFEAAERVAGSGSVAWTLLAAAAARLGLDPARAMPLVGAFAGALTVALVAFAGRARARERGAASPLHGATAATLVACSPSFAFYAGSGLETALFALLLACSAVALAARRTRLFALAASLALLTRPEGAALGAMGVATLALDPGSPRGAAMRRAAVAAALFGTAALALFAAEQALLAAPAPHGIVAALADRGAGARYLAAWLVSTGGLVAPALLATLERRERPGSLAWAALVAAVALAAVLEGGDSTPGHRLLAPLVPLLALVADAAIVRGLASRPRGVVGAAHATAAAVALISLPLGFATGTIPLRAFAAAEAADARRVEPVARDVAVSGARVVATADPTLAAVIGALDLDVAVVDLADGAGRAFAASPAALERAWTSHLEGRHVDALLFVTSEPGRVDAESAPFAEPMHLGDALVAKTSWFRERYRHADATPLGDGRWVHRYARVAPFASES